MDALTWWTGGLLVAGVVLPFYWRHMRRERRAERAATVAREHGLHQPVTIHPVVRAEACIGIGNCLSVCPEGEVLGLQDGQAIAISPAKCIGHGLCERSCPMRAIELVFGTATRGVELPRIKENFETNVPGIFVIGELGGMGLIRNAFEQGRQCIDGIAKSGVRGRPGMVDVLVVGCGPAGLAAALNCLHRGLSYTVIEKEDVGGTVRHYPRRKLVMTAPVTVPGYGKLRFREVRKEELVNVWEDVVRSTGLEVQTGEAVEGVTPLAGGGFTVTSDRGAYRARHVVLAIGRRGVPRKLGVPGEDRPKVMYSLREPEAFRNQQILVVGGGDSAVEAALALAAQDNEVSISYRRDAFSRIKDGNRKRIDAAIRRGDVAVLWSTTVVEIADDIVTYRNGGTGAQALPNDQVFIFAGGVLPTKFLQSCGIQIDVKFGSPLN